MMNKQSVKNRKQGGFTLIELLVVVSILAVISFIAVSGVGGYEAEAQKQLVHTEMKSITKAIYRFKADTGYFPKEGVFEVSEFGFLSSDDENLYNLESNFSWLVDEPLKSDGVTKVLEWQPNISRGWNGPYLTFDGVERLSTNIPTATCDLDESAFDASFGAQSIKSIPDTFIKKYSDSKIDAMGHCFANLIDGKWKPAESFGQPYQYLLTFKNDYYSDCPESGDGCIVLLSTGPNSEYEDNTIDCVVETCDDIVKILRVNN